jgi:hypothetical protein
MPMTRATDRTWLGDAAGDVQVGGSWPTRHVFVLERRLAMEEWRAMKRRRARILVLVAMTILTLAACGAEYSNPPEGFEESSLVGTWVAHYSAGPGVDTLVLRADGTFQQTFQHRTIEGYRFETPWNRWWMERFPDGRARLHLQGARFYARGVDTAEREGKQPYEFGPGLEYFWDPIALDFVTMVGELVLNVQNESTNGLVMLNMLVGSDEGWIFFWTGRDEDAFRRVDSPSTGR